MGLSLNTFIPVNKIVTETPRRLGDAPMTVTIGGKLRWDELMKIRYAIGEMFKASKLWDEWTHSIRENGLGNTTVLREKFGSYDPEWKRLYTAVIDTFKHAGRNELATEFARTVASYTSDRHPIDYIATLLKGSSHPVSVAAQANQYLILEPFRNLMNETLQSKGIHPPSDIADLTQLFYNTFVAKTGSGVEPMNFDTMLPGDVYHADEAVLNAVVTYVKTLIDKKQSGQTLPKVQDRIATAGISVQNKLTDEAKKEVEARVGETVVGNTKTILIVIAAVVVVVLFIAFKK